MKQILSSIAGTEYLLNAAILKLTEMVADDPEAYGMSHFGMACSPDESRVLHSIDVMTVSINLTDDLDKVRQVEYMMEKLTNAYDEHISKDSPYEQFLDHRIADLESHLKSKIYQLRGI